jgi:hypothetical protein
VRVGVDAVEQRDHRLVRPHDLGSEVKDARARAPLRESREEQRPRPRRCIVVDDRDGRLRDVGPPASG